MIKKYENKALLLNFDLANKKKGTVIKIKVDKVVKKIPIPKKNEEDEQEYKEKTEYIPIDRYWRDRIKDAKMDKCVEFVKLPEESSDVDKEVDASSKKKKKKKS